MKFEIYEIDKTYKKKIKKTKDKRYASLTFKIKGTGSEFQE